MTNAVSDNTLLSNFSYAARPDLPQPSLDKGERACIALALRLTAVVVTDDRDARRVARSLGLEISGTLGALCNLVNHGHLTVEAADKLLTKMLSKGYRSPVTSIKTLLGD